MKRLLALALSVLLAAPLVALGAPSAASAAAPQQVSIIANPHPDDEVMSASMYESASSNFQVFVYFTRGEQTSYCGAQRFTSDCMIRRIASTLGFLSQMSQSFPAIPGAWDGGIQTRAFADPSNVVRRDDAGTSSKNTTAWVYADTQGRGAAVFFDLGDGDLTSQEVAWALRTLTQNRADFGIPAALPLHNIVGALWAPEGTYPACQGYSHPDHRAVNLALWSERFGARYTAASNCAADSSVNRSQVASSAFWDAAFGAGGAFQAHYGWLRPEGWPHDGSGTTQWQHFNRLQPMWVRS